MGSKAGVWAGHLAAWRDSGLSQAGYCRQHDLRLPSFGYWRRRFGAPAPGAAKLPALVPIAVGAVDTCDTVIEVCLPNGLQVRLPVAMDPLHWVPLMQALRTC